MSLYLKEGEIVLKSWDYGKRIGKQKGKLNLTVTSDRVISTSYHRNRIDRKEFEVSAVKSVDSFTGIKRAGFWKILLAIIMFAYSTFLCAYSVVIFRSEELIKLLGKETAIIYVCSGALLFVLAILLLRRKKLFSLRILLRATPPLQAYRRRAVYNQIGAFSVPIILTCLFGFAFYRFGLNSMFLSRVILLDVIFLGILLSWITTIRKHRLNKRLRAIKTPPTSRRIKIKVNKRIVNEILEEIGATIIDAKEKTFLQPAVAEQT